MKSVLIVDDEKMTLKLMSEIVLKLGYYPILATDGERALKVLEDNPMISGVLTDYQMPNMDGIEFLEKMKSIKKFEKIPIMIFSAYIKLKQITEVLDKGATAFMPKPISKINIEEFLTRHVG